MKCIVLKPSHIQGFLCNFKIERDISISFGKKWSWPPCMMLQLKFAEIICFHVTFGDTKLLFNLISRNISSD